jgi:hypothetical protein
MSSGSTPGYDGTQTGEENPTEDVARVLIIAKETLVTILLMRFKVVLLTPKAEDPLQNNKYETALNQITGKLSNIHLQMAQMIAKGMRIV